MPLLKSQTQKARQKRKVRKSKIFHWAAEQKIKKPTICAAILQNEFRAMTLNYLKKWMGILVFAKKVNDVNPF